MTLTRKLATVGVLALLLGIVFLAPQAYGSDKGQLYGGLLFTFSNTIGGSFDGNSGASTSGIYSSVPKLNAAPGFGALLGVRGEIFGVELSYLYSANRGSVYDPTPAFQSARSEKPSTHAVSLDFKFHFWPQSTVGAYAFAGASLVLVNVKRDCFGNEATGLKPGSTTEYLYEWKALGDITFLGFGIGLGAGLEIALGPRFVLTGGFLIRPTFFTSISIKPYESGTQLDQFDFTVRSTKGYFFGVTAGLNYYISKQ